MTNAADDPTIHFDPAVWQLFDRYVHGDIDRRGFLAGASRFAVGTLTASAMLELLSPRFAQAQQVAANDSRLQSERLSYPSPDGYEHTSAYLVRPASASTNTARVLVIHENRGLNPHIEDVARRFALAGYVALAPDALAPLGGYPGDEDSARAKFAELDQARTRADMAAAARFLHQLDDQPAPIGVVGFCWGGGQTNLLAARLPELVVAAAPFYGPAPPLDEVKAIRAELLVVLAESDERINAGWAAYEQALSEAGVRHALLKPAGTQHGFHNDTTPRYNPEAAALAWQRTLELYARAFERS